MEDNLSAQSAKETFLQTFGVQSFLFLLYKRIRGGKNVKSYSG
jgi:hypothetical protein